MSTALQDLPDPLEPPPALPSSSPDELLAKLADDAIDKLMAGESAATAGVTPPQTDAAVNATPEPAEVPPLVAEAPPPAVDVPAVAVVDDAAAKAEPVAEADATAASLLETTPVDPTAAVPPPPASDVKALLHDDSADAAPSPLLLPLRVVNAPFAWLGDRGRTFAGLLAVVTLVPAACAVVWVLYFKGR